MNTCIRKSSYSYFSAFHCYGLLKYFWSQPGVTGLRSTVKIKNGINHDTNVQVSQSYVHTQHHLKSPCPCCHRPLCSTFPHFFAFPTICFQSQHFSLYFLKWCIHGIRYIACFWGWTSASFTQHSGFAIYLCCNRHHWRQSRIISSI